MLNFLKRTVLVVLSILSSISLLSCSQPVVDEEEQPAGNFPAVHDTLTWDKINAFPIANSSMSTQELRKLCVDFFRFSKTFAWTPDEDFFYVYRANGYQEVVLVDTVYGGLPYITKGSGNVYRTMDFYNPKTGVMDMSAIGDNAALFGNQCSNASQWAWGKVVNSADFRNTNGMVLKNGYLRVGPYVYDDTLEKYGSATTTTAQICEDNGVDTMYESYAALQMADGLVSYPASSGHVIMCVENHVVRKDDGTINSEESYIIFLDQSVTWEEHEQSNGDKFTLKNSIDAKWSYATLFEQAYLPFTFPELLGTNTVEKSECTFSYSGKKITVQQLVDANVSANYHISDIYVIVKDKKGKEVVRQVKRATDCRLKGADLSDFVTGGPLNEYANGKHTVEVIVQLSTGERPTIYKGKLKN